jgi:glutathione S-transferase
MAAAARNKYRHLFALHARIQHRPRIAGYVASPRRISFHQDGIFRRYPELQRPSRLKSS